MRKPTKSASTMCQELLGRVGSASFHLDTENWREALDLVDEATGRRADWVPRQAESIAPLARAALQKGRPQVAASLIRGFDKKYPAHPDVAQVYFFGAQLMAESAGKPD